MQASHFAHHEAMAMHRATCCRLQSISAVVQEYDYFFAENGLVSYRDGKVLEIQARPP